MRVLSIFIIALFFVLTLWGQQKEAYQNHWEIKTTKSIRWDLDNDQNLPHQDNIEMAGKRVAAIVT